MDKQNIIETSLQRAKNWTDTEFIEDDILLTEHINQAPIPSGPQRMNFILIALCTRGQARYNIDTQEQTVGPGEVIIVSERHVVDHYWGSPDLEGLCMMVSVGFYREIIKNVSDVSALFLFTRTHPVYRLDAPQAETFKKYFYAIKKRIGDTDNHFRKDLVRTLMLAMFYDLSNVIYQFRQVADQRQTRADLIFTRFIKLVEEHCTHERRVGWYALQLGITAKYLSETVKTASRRTPNEWIDNYVTLELRVMLKNSTKSIKEITREMNFPNQSFLGKYFKEHVGVSPSQYRHS